MTPADPTLQRFGTLLRELKDTYSWQALRAMPSEDLIVLLKRSARNEEDRAALLALEPWIHGGLLGWLSIPPRQRVKRSPEIARALGSPADQLQSSMAQLDRVLALTRTDRRGFTTTSVEKTEETPPARSSRITPLLVAAVVLGFAGSLALTVQIGRYREEVQRQQQAGREQKAELDRIKRQLSQREQTGASGPPDLSSPLPGIRPLPRPSLPPGQPEPSQPTTPEPAPPVEEAAAALRWSGCERLTTSGPAPQTGDTWWPVVGPTGSLEAVRRHCRSDAFLNRDGNVQVASFRDRTAAGAFADDLSADRVHPYTFRVGEPTTYD